MERRYQNALRLLDENKAIHPDNRAKILEFLTHCKARELRKARYVFYLQRLTIIATTLGPVQLALIHVRAASTAMEDSSRVMTTATIAAAFMP